MSDLQIGLILLGIVLILLVVLFNWWQDRRVRQKMQQQFPEREQDPLMNSGFFKPQERREPGLGGALSAAAEGDEPAAADDAADDPGEVDPATEVVIDIVFAQPVDSVQLGGGLQSLVQQVHKPLRIFATSEAGGHHAWLRPGVAYVSLQLAVALANRQGALSDIEWSRLWSVAQQLAGSFDGSVEAPEQAEVLRRAAELDAACAQLDAQVALTLALSQARPRAELARVLEDAGFNPQRDQLLWLAEDGRPRFAAHFVEEEGGIARIDLLLDVPNSPADSQAFSRMAGVGRDLARRLGAALLDDLGQPVAEGAEAAIDKQLQALQDRLARAGFDVASERAARVFS